MSDSTAKAKAALATARLIIMGRAPYFATGLYTLVPIAEPGLGTMGVTTDARLYYDPAAVLRWRPEELASVLVHELTHVLRSHCQRKGDRQGDLWNVAVDYTTNDDLRAGGWILPAGALDRAKDGLPTGQLPEQLYELLKQAGRQAPSKPDACGGWDGSGAGHALPNEPPPQQATKPSAGEPATGANIPTAATAGAAGRSGAELDRARRAVASALQEHVRVKGRGNVPGGWDVWADEALTPPTIPWQQLLRRAVRVGVADRAGGVDYSYRRPSRRQGGLGYGPGRPVVPSLRQPIPQVAIVIDTSGSMGTDELRAVVSEVAGVVRSLGVPLTLYTADTQIAGQHAIRTVTDVAKLRLHGGGGTDFRPAIEAALEQRPRPDVLIYLTDGDGDYPDLAPARCRVIWALTNDSAAEPPWGITVKIGDR